MDAKNIFFTFKLNSGDFAINIDDVISIERITEITKVPRAPQYVVGIINLRGDIIPVIDLNIKMSNSKTDYQNENRILVVNIDDEKFGFIVNKAEQVLEVEDQDIQLVDQLFDDNKNIKGVINQEGHIFQILDHKMIVDDTRGV